MCLPLSEHVHHFNYIHCENKAYNKLCMSNDGAAMCCFEDFHRKKVKLENSASQPVNKQPPITSSVMPSMSCYKLYFMCNVHTTGTYLHPVLKASCRFDLSTTTIRRPFWGVGEGGRESLQQRIFDLFIYSLMFSLVGGKIKV